MNQVISCIHLHSLALVIDNFIVLLCNECYFNIKTSHCIANLTDLILHIVKVIGAKQGMQGPTLKINCGGLLPQGTHITQQCGWERDNNITMLCASLCWIIIARKLSLNKPTLSKWTANELGPFFSYMLLLCKYVIWRRLDRIVTYI